MLTLTLISGLLMIAVLMARQSASESLFNNHAVNSSSAYFTGWHFWFSYFGYFPKFAMSVAKN